MHPATALLHADASPLTLGQQAALGCLLGHMLLRKRNAGRARVTLSSCRMVTIADDRHHKRLAMGCCRAGVSAFVRAERAQRSPRGWRAGACREDDVTVLEIVVVVLLGILDGLRHWNSRASKRLVRGGGARRACSAAARFKCGETGIRYRYDHVRYPGEVRCASYQPTVENTIALMCN